MAKGGSRKDAKDFGLWTVVIYYDSVWGVEVAKFDAEALTPIPRFREGRL